MPNRTYALEWLEYSKRNIQAAEILFREKHYTDVIAVELHQGVEPSHDENFDTHAVNYISPHGQKNKVGVLASSI